jgi:hypothetical protein
LVEERDLERSVIRVVTYTRATFPGERAPCHNARRRGGGVAVGAALRAMARAREARREGRALCAGRERSPTGRRVARACLDAFWYTVEVTDAPAGHGLPAVDRP